MPLAMLENGSQAGYDFAAEMGHIPFKLPSSLEATVISSVPFDGNHC